MSGSKKEAHGEHSPPNSATSPSEAGLTNMGMEMANLSDNETHTRNPSTTQDSSEDKEVEQSYPQGLAFVSLMTAVCVGFFLVLLDSSIIVTAIPRITSQFHSLPDIGWYGSAYQLACSALQPITGKIYMYYRPKWIYLVSLFLFMVGSLLCAVAPSSLVLIIGRAVAGVGGAGLQTGFLTIIAAAVPLERQPVLMGSTMGLCQLGIVAGPLIGGALTEYSTWRWCFYINLPIGAITAGLMLFVNIPDRRATKAEEVGFKYILPRLDLPGFAIFAPASVMILLAIQWGGDKFAWNSATIIGLLVGGILAAVVFFVWEGRQGDDKAMLPLGIIKQQEIWSACLTMLLLVTGVFVASYYLPLYFQSVKGTSPFTSGVDTLPLMASQLFFAMMTGYLVEKIGYYLPFAVASAVILAIGNGLWVTFDANTTTAYWAGLQILVGFGRGLSLQIPLLALQANSKPHNIPIVSAFFNFAQTFGGAIFLTAGNAIFNNKLGSELAARVPNVDSAKVIAAGATGFRAYVSKEDLPGAIAAYANSINATYYLSVGAAVAMFASSWLIGWKDIRKKAPGAGGGAVMAGHV